MFRCCNETGRIASRCSVISDMSDQSQSGSLLTEGPSKFASRATSHQLSINGMEVQCCSYAQNAAQLHSSALCWDYCHLPKRTSVIRVHCDMVHLLF